MVKSYCVKNKIYTDSVPGSEEYRMSKNGRLMLASKCVICKMMKTKFVKYKKSLN